MSLRLQSIRGAVTLTAGQAIAQLIGFARNVVIARLLSPQDIGIAATLAIALSLLDLLGDVSLDKLLIQSENGEVPRLQATAHLIAASRGLVQAVVLVFLSEPLALFFDLPGKAWAFQCVAIGLLLRGLAHSDISRLQRELRFGPATIAELLPQVVGLALVYPLAVWLGDFRAVLIATLIQGAIYVVLTHAVAVRRYRWAYDSDCARQVFVFGWPLLINGALLFAINQGDRAVLGAAYSKDDLGLYTVAASLTAIPTSMLFKLTGGLFLPVLARSATVDEDFRTRYSSCLQLTVLLSMLCAVPMVLAGSWAVVAIYGSAYGGAASLIGWMAIVQSVRAVRSLPTLAALSRGDSPSVLVSNVVRAGALPMTVVAASYSASMLVIVQLAFAGEVIALAAGVLWLKRRHKVAVGIHFYPILMLACIIVIAVECSKVLPPTTAAVLSVPSVVIFFGLMATALPAMRAECARFICKRLLVT